MGAIVDMGAYEFQMAEADQDGDGDVDGSDFLIWAVCFNGSLNPPGCP